VPVPICCAAKISTSTILTPLTLRWFSLQSVRSMLQDVGIHPRADINTMVEEELEKERDLIREKLELYAHVGRPCGPGVEGDEGDFSGHGW
jgi:hypothetical protein